jgi:hypothetical protein
MQKEEPKILVVVGMGPILKHVHEAIEQHRKMGYEIQYTDKMPPPQSQTKEFPIENLAKEKLEELTKEVFEIKAPYRFGEYYPKNQRKRYNRNKYRKP